MTWEMIDRTTLFKAPGRTVRVEASLDPVYDLRLDEVEGGQYDFLYDVVYVQFLPEDVVFEKCRTWTRPWREQVTLPRATLASVCVEEDHETA